MAKKTHYPSYDVMKEKDHWDDHTGSIVRSRLIREREFQFLQFAESEMLKRVCIHLTGDKREDIIQYVILHIDETLGKNFGEGQRKPGVPSARILIRDGLKAIHQASEAKYFLGFLELDEASQRQLLADLSKGQAAPVPEWDSIPQVELFQKLMSLAVEAYYSHPSVWSEIGYGGPAYPRGYVRTQLGQLDPWEAQPET